MGLGCAWCWRGWRGWPAFFVDRRLSFLVWSCYWTYSHVPVTAFPISPRTLRRDRSTRVCVCPRLSGHPRGPSIGDGMDDKCTRKSPRVKTKNNGELVGRASWEVKAWGRCKPDHPLLLGDLGSRTHKTEKVKRRRRFHRHSKRSPHSGNLGSCCAVLPLCETYDRGEHDERERRVRVQFVRLAAHLMLCTTSCRVAVVVVVCASRRYTRTRCMQPVPAGVSRFMYVRTETLPACVSLAVDVRGCLLTST